MTDKLILIERIPSAHGRGIGNDRTVRLPLPHGSAPVHSFGDRNTRLISAYRVTGARNTESTVQIAKFCLCSCIGRPIIGRVLTGGEKDGKHENGKPHMANISAATG